MRPQRYDIQRTYHHVVSRGTSQWNIFLDDLDRRKFLAIINRIHERYGVEVVAFCLMGNHFHLILYCPDANLSNALRDLKSQYARSFNRRHGRTGPLYEQRFFSKMVGDDGYFLTAIRYVHRNPLELNPTADLGDYLYSSHGIYLGRRVRPRWLRPDTALQLFGADYQRIVETPVDSDKVQNQPHLCVASPGHATQRSSNPLASIATVKRRVAAAAGCELSEIAPRRRNGLLALVAFIAIEYGGLLAEEAADPCGFTSAGSARMAASRARRRLQGDPVLQQVVTTVVGENAA